MKYKLIYPIQGINSYEAENPNEAVKLCYTDIPNHIKTKKIVIMNINTSETFTFKIVCHNKQETIRRIEKKIDKLLSLSKKNFLNNDPQQVNLLKVLNPT